MNSKKHLGIIMIVGLISVTLVACGGRATIADADTTNANTCRHTHPLGRRTPRSGNRIR